MTYGFVLNVTEDEAIAIEQFYLNEINNYALDGKSWKENPENKAVMYKFDEGSKYQKYEFTEVNCATIVRDALESSVGDRMTQNMKDAISPYELQGAFYQTQNPFFRLFNNNDLLQSTEIQ